MRKWLLLFLLLVVPLQLTWAATSVYCKHGKELATQHVGHHSHQHPKQAHDIDGESQLGKLDLDCGTCHASCSFAVAVLAGNSVLSLANPIGLAATRPFTSLPLKVPDRPQWISQF